MKDAYARHGIPTELVSDNGSQYKSFKFRAFAREWEFNHTTSSPRYPQSNGLAESSVKTIKKTMKKCLASNMDVKKALLSIRNTPLSCGASPAELLMNRQLRDNMPRLPTTTDTKKAVNRDLVAERSKQKEQHDKNIRKTATNNKFHPGQTVAIQDHISKEWSIRGTIVEEVAPRSFTVQVYNKGILRRNQRQIRKTYSTTSYTTPCIQPAEPETNEDSDSDTDTIPYGDSDASTISEENELMTTRSGRIVKQKLLLDYEYQ